MIVVCRSSLGPAIAVIATASRGGGSERRIATCRSPNRTAPPKRPVGGGARRGRDPRPPHPPHRRRPPASPSTAPRSARRPTRSSSSPPGAARSATTSAGPPPNCAGGDDDAVLAISADPPATPRRRSAPTSPSTTSRLRPFHFLTGAEDELRGLWNAWGFDRALPRLRRQHPRPPRRRLRRKRRRDRSRSRVPRLPPHRRPVGDGEVATTRSGAGEHRDAGQVGEAAAIERQDRTRRAAAVAAIIRSWAPRGAARAADVSEQIGVGLGDLKVVDLDRDRVQDRGDEKLALLFRRPFANRTPRRNSATVTAAIATSSASPTASSSDAAAALRVDQDRGVEDQSRHGSGTGPRLSRSSSSSAAHRGRDGRPAARPSAPCRCRRPPARSSPRRGRDARRRRTRHSARLDRAAPRSGGPRRSRSVASGSSSKSDYLILVVTARASRRPSRRG